MVTDALEHDFAAVRPLNGGAYQAAQNRVVWNLGAMEPGQERILELEVTLAEQVADETVISNQVRISYAENQAPVLTDDPATDAPGDPTRVTVRSQPLLVLEKTADRAVVQPGEVLTYTLTLRNEGTDAARNIRLVDPLPAGVFENILADGAQQNGDRLEWTAASLPELAQLDVGDTVRVEIRARLVDVLDNGLRIENQARVDAGFGESLSDDPATGVPQDPTTVTVQSTPQLVFTKVVSDLNGGEPQPGDRFRYTIAMRNEGNGAAEQILVTDPIPAGLADIAVGEGGVLADGVIRWAPVERLAPGTPPVEFTFEGTASPELGTGTVIANQAELTAW